MLGTLPGYDNHIHDIKQLKVTILQPYKTLKRKSSKLFDEMQDEMIFRTLLPTQLDINKSPKSKVIHECEIPISIKELNAAYEKSLFFKDIYNCITKGYVPSQITQDALKRLKMKCEDYLVMHDVLLRIEIAKAKHILPSVIPETYVPTILS